MKKFIKYSLLVFVLLFSFVGIAQEDFKNEEDRKKHADKLFDKGEYVEASPHILHFLSLNQTSPEYNFKYGVCLMYSDEDKEKSLRYLKFSASKGGGGDNRVYFFLGKSYHLNYNFKQALKNYQKFKEVGEDDYKESLQVDLHIQMCQNGKKLLNNLTELVVYEKTESSFDRFQYSYDLKEIGGTILVSSEFQSKYDKKVGYKSVVYFPPLNQDILFFSSYGKNGSTGLDLYLVKRGASGDFGSPQKLPESINTPYDDAYGFLHADGRTFYFSSKGLTSMGGYDVFKVDYEPQTNQFGTPKNLDYKINTPDDDIMYIVDPNFENAYFSSSRAAKGGYLDVYKVKVETFPIVNVILAGKFENKINPEDAAATIKVENMQSGQIEGIYNPDNAGNYVIVLPRSGKYKFIVETPESDKIHTGIVEIPAQKVMKPLKQSLALIEDAGVEKLVINNLFNQEVANADEIMAKVLKGMSDPDPNAEDFPDSLYNNEDLVTEALDKNYSVDDLVELSADKAKEIQEEANELKKRMEAAYTVANSKSQSAKELTRQADETLKEIETISNPLDKQEKIQIAKKAHAQSKDLNMLATTALNLANSLKKEYDKKQVEATNAKNVAVEIEKAVNENSHDKAIAALTELQSRIDDLIKDNSGYKSGFDEIVEKAKLKQEEADKANIEAQEFREAEDELNLRLSELGRELEKSKDKDKPLVQRQIDDIKEQFLLNDELAKESFKRSAVIQKEADILNHQVDLMSNLYDDIDAGTTVELTEEEKQQVNDYLASNELADNISKNENNLNQHNEESTSTEVVNATNSEVNPTVELTSAEKELIITNAKDEFVNYEEELASLSIDSENNIEEQENKKRITTNWVTELELKINETTNKIESSSNPKETLELEEKLAWLKTEKLDKENEISSLSESIASLNNSSNVNDSQTSNTSDTEEFELTEEDKSSLIAEEKKNYKSYEEELNNIDDSGDDEEVAIAKKKINEDWVTAIDGEIMDTEDKIALASDPKKKKLAEEKLAWLNEQKAEKVIDLNFIEEELASYNETKENTEIQTDNATSEESIVLTSEDKKNIIEQEEKNYESFERRISAVENEENNQSIEEKTLITQEWVSEIESQINTTEQDLENTSDTKEKLELETKLAWLNNEKDGKENQLEDYELAAKNLLAENNVTDETEIIKENEKAEDWLTIIDNDINELSNKIANEVDGSRKTELIAQRDNLIQLKEEKQNIVETNSDIIEKSNEQKEIEKTEDYKELAEELENTSYQPKDFEGSFTTKLDYKSEVSNQLIAENSTKVDEIIVMEQELTELENQLAETNREKKKEGIQKQIDKKIENKLALELAISENIKAIDEAEYTTNEENLKTLVTEAKLVNNPIINDQNYQSAKILEEKYISQNNDANQLLEEAAFIENETKKTEKVKEAHSIQQAAIKNQEEAITLLEQMVEPDYEPSLIRDGSNLLVDETIEVLPNPQDEFISADYLSNQKSSAQKLLTEFEAVPDEEKEDFLANWKSDIDVEFNENMRLLTSDIPDEDKEVINENLIYLRSEKQKIEEKQDELVNLANVPDVNNQTDINQVEEIQTEDNQTEETKEEDNQTAGNQDEERSTSDNNEVVENTNDTQTNTDSTTEDTLTSDNNQNDTNEIAENTTTESTSEVASLLNQKEIFNNFEDKLGNTTSKEEKETVYNDWIAKIDNQLEENQSAIEGNITVDEEAIIQSKIDWLKEEKETKQELLNELESENIVASTNSNQADVNSPKVSKEVIENSKLKNEVEGIAFYSANKELTTYDVSTNVPTENLTNQLEFNSTNGNEIVQENESKINKVKKHETTIDVLEIQKYETNDEKEIKSFGKKIDKAIVKKSKAELKLSEDFKKATEKDDALITTNLLEVKTLLSDEVNEKEFAYQQAKEYEEKAESLKNEANQLRNEAGGLKSASEKSKMINKALSKEKASIAYKKKASKLYSEAIVNSYTVNEDEIVAVSENSEERSSHKIIEAANQADNLAYEYSTRASELRDSAETVKKKNRSKVIQEAEVYTQKAEAQELIAEALKTEGKRVEEKEGVVLENELLLTNLSKADVEKVRTAENYDNIYNNQLAIDAFLKELKKEEEMMNSFNNLAIQQENKAKEYQEKSKNASSEEESLAFNSIANKLLEKADENRAKQDSVLYIIDDIEDQKTEVEQEQFDLITLFDEGMQNDIKGLLLSNYDKTPKVKEEIVEETPTEEYVAENFTSSSFKAPEVLNTNIVVINNNREESSYSESNPIPLNPKNPKGLVYKVQVGAFRKPIPQDLFKGFAPISAERINDDITRYRVGYFVNFETANVSKNQIRQIGYPDAFVVAVLDGKRISMTEARAYAINPTTEVLANNNSSEVPENASITPENTTNEIAANQDNTDANTTDENTTVLNETTVTETEEEIVPDYVKNLDGNAAEVSAVESIKGLFYTVQVGAFSKPIAKTAVFNISPLVTKYVNGLYKYTTGIYKSVQDADGRKNEVRAKGVPDAFVIAYYNGERITIAEAVQILAEQGDAAFASKAEGENTEPSPKKIIEEISNQGENTEIETREISELAKPSYLENQKKKFLVLEKSFEASNTEGKKKIIIDWNETVDQEFSKNMKLLISDIPDAEKDVINANLSWLRAEKEKIQTKEASIEVATNTDESTNVIEDENKSTFYIDLGIYYGTVPTAIAEALLTNKKAKVKRNKINESATQYYSGVFLTKDEVVEIWTSFVDKGLSDAKIVEIKYGEEFILIEKDEPKPTEVEPEEIKVEEEAIEEEGPSQENSISVVNTKLVYRVELGTFNGSMPISTGRVFLELGYLGIEKVKSNNQETYYCGKVNTEAEANELKQKFLEKGIEKAKTVAFVGERKISIEEASELQK